MSDLGIAVEKILDEDDNVESEKEQYAINGAESSTKTPTYKNHCVKSVQIRSYLWSVFFCIRTEYGETFSR